MFGVSADAATAREQFDQIMDGYKERAAGLAENLVGDVMQDQHSKERGEYLKEMAEGFIKDRSLTGLDVEKSDKASGVVTAGGKERGKGGTSHDM
jgi:hypothetical protein